jgi:hypothetical protein
MSEQLNESQPEAPEKLMGEIMQEKRELIEQIATQLGFNENLELKALRAQMVDESGNISIEILGQWRDGAEALVESSGDKGQFKKAQIGLLVSKALVYLGVNNLDAFYEDIDDAIMYTEELGLEDMAQKLKGL